MRLKKLSLCDIVIAITSRSNNIKVKYSKIFLSFLERFENVIQRQDRALRALQLCCASNINSMVASYWKIQLKTFYHTFPIHFDCDFTFNFSFWRSGTFWAKIFNSCSARWDLSFEIHIGGGPGNVFNFIVSNSGEGAINKLTTDSNSGALTTPGTIVNGQKFDYK